MSKFQEIGCDVPTLGGESLGVIVTDEGDIGVDVFSRDGTECAPLIGLTAAAAHELGTKLRLAAKKAGR